MRFLVSVSLTLTVALTLAHRAEAERLAVLIGADSYDRMPGLQYCAADARELADTLIERCDYKRHNVTILSDGAYNKEYLPLQKSIHSALAQVADGASEEDTILVFFAGHALTDGGKCYLIPADGDAKNSVPLLWVKEQLEKTKATRKLLVLDVSRNGTRSGDVAAVVSAMKPADGLVVALASGKDQTSRVDENAGHGVFASRLMLGMSGAAADKNGKVGMKALQEHMTDAMKNLQERTGAEQTPVFVGEATDGFIVSYARSAIQGLIVTMRPGKGEFASINRAIAAARPKDRIVVRPGTYKENVVINKPVAIVAGGPVEKVVLASDVGTCIVMQTDKAIVRGLTLRCRAHSPEHKIPAVLVPAGRLLLEECDIASSSGSCVSATGKQASVTMRRCRAHDSKFHSLCFQDGARGLIEDCEVYGNAFSGIQAYNGAEVTVRRCKVRDRNHVGIYYQFGATGTVEDCDVYDSHNKNMIVGRGATVAVRRCKIHDAGEMGVWSVNRASVTLEDCDIYGNGMSNVMVQELATAVLRRCKVRDGKQAGAYIYRAGRVTMEDCEISGNGSSGVALRDDGTDCIASNCTVTNNKGSGLYVQGGATGTMEDSELRGNEAGGVDVEEHGSAVIRRCKVNKNKGDGMHAQKGGQLTVEDSELLANTRAGVAIEINSSLIVRRCKVNGNTWGVKVLVHSSATVEDSDLTDNGSGGAWNTDPFSTLTRTRNKE